ncbi:hypothetical protein [Myxosarcina sp. GI1(2024)]
MIEQIKRIITQDRQLKKELKLVSDLGEAAELIVASGKGRGYNFTVSNVALALHKIMGTDDNSNQLSEGDLLASAGKGIRFRLLCTDPTLPGTCAR